MCKLHHIAAAALLVSGLWSCADTDSPVVEAAGEGSITLSASIADDVDAAVVSRAESTADADNPADRCNIWIQNSRGVVRRYASVAEIPGEITLTVGDYTVCGTAGDSVPTSFTHRYFRGSQAFSVANGKWQRVSLVCKIMNSVVEVEFSDDVASVLDDFSLSVGHSQCTAVFDGSDPSMRAYFMMTAADRDLSYTLSGRLKDGSPFERTGVIEGARPTTLYSFYVSAPAASGEYGGALFDIDIAVDESEIVGTNKYVGITAAPIFRMLTSSLELDPDNSLDGPLSPSQGQGYTVGIYAGCRFSSLQLDCKGFADVFGLGGSDFDLMRIRNDAREALAAAGLTFTVETAMDGEGISTGKQYAIISFDSRLIDALRQLGTGRETIAMAAVDEGGRRSDASLSLVFDPATVHEAVRGDIRARRASVSASLFDASLVSSAALRYWPRGNEAAALELPFAGAGLQKFALTGLEPSTVYEYCVTVGSGGSDAFTSEALSFTTEDALQLPNSDFELWTYTSNAWYARGESDALFWDSGNDGSKTYASTNVTTRTSDKAHGTYAARLASQYVGIGGTLGRFAAGNIFIGKFLGTNGTNGILGWGRRFTDDRDFDARPDSLVFWAHYSPVNINYVASNAPAEYKNGDLDRATVYIALLDATNFTGTDYPVRVDTSVPTLFNPDGSNVIAYGVWVSDGATDGDDLVRISVPLDYRDGRLSDIPVYVLLTAAASKGGDYFTGGSGSVLIIDDIQLIYRPL